MVKTLKILSEEEIKILKLWVENQKNQRQDLGGRRNTKLWNDGDDQNTPDLYIALPPSGGIPALSILGSVPAEGDIPGYADCSIYKITHTYPDEPEMVQMDVPDKRVYNLTTSIIPGGTTWITVHRSKSGQWIVPGSSASTNEIHCRVTECLGDGYYRAKLALSITFSIPADQTTGTGTSTVANPTCEPCDLILGEGPGTATASNPTVSCGTLSTPNRIVPDGEQDIIIYDPRAVPLKVPGHAVIVDMGDTAAQETTGTGTGTGTSDTEKIYIVLTGTYEVVGIPDRFYKCCNNSVLLSRCDTYITEGSVCVGTEIDCPTTGTGTA